MRPTVVRRYGRYMKGDYVPAELFDEIRLAINLMRHIARPLSWTAFFEPWIDKPLALGVVDSGGAGSLSDGDTLFTAELVGKDVQIRSWATW